MVFRRDVVDFAAILLAYFQTSNLERDSQETSIDCGVKVLNFTTSKNPTVNITTFPHSKIHKFTLTSPDG
jgi:hypothetical protein